MTKDQIIAMLQADKAHLETRVASLEADRRAAVTALQAALDKLPMSGRERTRAYRQSRAACVTNGVTNVTANVTTDSADVTKCVTQTSQGGGYRGGYGPSLS